jgi:hypothetical protein
MAYLEQGYYIEDLFDLIFPADAGVRGHLAMIFGAYLDDSSDQTQSRVIVSGSFIGNRDQWKELRQEWSAKLQEHGISYYKSSEHRMLKGQFLQFQSDLNYPKPSGRETADRIRLELEKIVKQVGIGGIGVVIPVPIFEEVSVMPGFKEKMGSTPYHLALQTIFLNSVQEIKRFPGYHKIAFVHDEQHDSALLNSVYLAFKQKNPSTAKYMAGFSCLDDKDHPPLQSADMIANTTCDFARQWYSNPTEANLRLLKESVLRISVWDKEFMLNVLRGQK